MTEYFTHCPWCKEEGMTTLTGYSSIPNTDKICEYHAHKVFEEWAEKKREKKEANNA